MEWILLLGGGAALVVVWNRIGDLQRKLETADAFAKALERQLSQLKAELHRREPSAASPVVPKSDESTAAPKPAPAPPAPPILEAEPPSVGRRDTPLLASPLAAAAETAEPKVEPTPTPTASPAPKPPEEPATPAEKPRASDGLAPPPPWLPATPPTKAPPKPPRPTFDWESLVGVRLFSWIAGIALVGSAVFFLRYSIDQGWLGPPVRMAIGLVVGAGLLVATERRSRRYAVTANALAAAGLAILFSTLFAAAALWHLIPQVAAFGLMALVTAVAVLLSLRHDSIFVALLGLVGGFATPILLSTGEDKPIGLFGYLLLLDIGLAWVAARKHWSLLLAASVGFTAIYQWGWIIKFVADKPDELPLGAAVFLLFGVVLAVAALLGGRSHSKTKEPFGLPSFFEPSLLVSASLPLLFALSMALSPTFAAHTFLLFGFLFLVDLGLAVLGASPGRALLHGAAGLGTLLCFAGWLHAGYDHLDWPAVLGLVSAFCLLYLGAPIVARRLARPYQGSAAWVVLTAPLLLFVFPVLALIEPATAQPLALFGVLFGLIALMGAGAILQENGPIHFIASFFAVGAEAAWSARHLSVDRLTEALTIYAVFGLFYVGVPVIARRLGKRLAPEGSGAVLVLLALVLLLFLAAGPVAQAALWGMGLILALLNLGLFFEARFSRIPLLALIGVVLSWVVIGVWWTVSMVAVLLVPALIIVAGFAMLIVAGNLWATQGKADAPKTAFGQGLYLGLVGHLFLAFVATQPALAVPPWPLLGILLVLDLAILVAALFSRRAELLVGALGLSQVVLIAFVWAMGHVTAGTSDLNLIALCAALGVSVLGLAAIPMAKRRQGPGPRFVMGAAAALYLGQLVALLVGASAPATATGWLAATHGLLLIGLGTLAFGERYELAIGALVLPSLSLPLWSGAHPELPWVEPLGFAAVPYLLFNAYPLLLGIFSRQRAAQARRPTLVAALASLPFFFAAREAMIRGGHGDVIGALPIGEALVLAVLLLQALRLGRTEKKDVDRIALLAGVGLGFVTAAIPLQLENEWVTLSWSLEAAALCWLYGRLRHPGLLWGAVGLATAVVLRLSGNPAVLSYHPRGDLRVFNWYLYTYGLSAVALLLGAWLLSSTADRLFERALPRFPRSSSLLAAGGTLLLFLCLNIEIADWFSTGTTITFNWSSTLPEDMTYTLCWALFAISLLAVGIVIKSAAARIAALVLLVATIGKAFLHDLMRLGGLYRVGSLLGLAVSLALVALALQRFVIPPKPDREAQ